MRRWDDDDDDDDNDDDDDDDMYFMFPTMICIWCFQSKIARLL